MVYRKHYKQAAYEQALSFRKRGFTYTEIAKICNVSRGTVSAWLSKESFSQQVAVINKKRAATANRERIKLINKARRSERAMQHTAMLRAAETEYKHYRHSPLFIAGLTVYLSNGDQKHSRLLRLSSKRPELHRVFIAFSKEFLGVDKSLLRFWLLLYPIHDEVACMKYWIKHAKLSAGQFHKNQVLQSVTPKQTLHFGVGNTIIGSTLLKRKLMRWLELLQKELKN